MNFFNNILSLCLLFVVQQLVYAQNKTDIPTTYNEVCFYTIKKTEFEDFLEIKKAIDREEFNLVYAAIRKMRTNLKDFSAEKSNRAFEFWYMGNYTEFDKQAIVAKESTLEVLKNYESRLRSQDALYYEHRLFLEQYLAFHTEAFYADYWFMSQERYFSRATVERVSAGNEEGFKLFSNSEFYRPFDVFNKMAASENDEIKDYLDVERAIADTSSFIPYSYMLLDKSTATYILETFKFDDVSQELNLDRQIGALKEFLEAVKEDKIYLMARFNHLELRKMRALELHKKRE